MLAFIARFAEIRSSRLAFAAVLAAVAVVLFVRLVRARPMGLGALTTCVLIGLAAGGATYVCSKLTKAYVGSLGRNLPEITLLSPRSADRLGSMFTLRAHATDKPGSRGLVAAVRRIEFWLYHPSFAEQHAGNHESKLLLGIVEGPTPDDAYSTTWTCSNPYTPARDGDHGGGDGTRTYVLPDDGRTYSIQAHGLDDEWFAKPGAPGKSERVRVEFKPCT